MRFKSHAAGRLLNKAWGLALVLAAGTASAAAAEAQDTQAPAADTAAPASAPAAPETAPTADSAQTEQPGQLAEVVVTATKREQSVRSIPESITTISGNDLEQRNAQNVDDVAKLVPGVNIEKSDGQASRITINGISSQPYTGFTAGVLFGDVSFTDEYIPFAALDPQPFDLKSVDVLKGPQGTLFGASALNGAIRYVPNDPGFRKWEFRYFGQYSNYVGGEFKPEYGGVINLPIGDSLALRLTGFERETPGYVTNTKLGLKDDNTINQGGARGVLRWAPIDPLDVKLTLAWQNTHVADGSETDNANGDLESDDRPRLSPTRNAYVLADLNASYDFDWAKLVSETADVRKRMAEFADASRDLPGDLPIAAITQSGQSSTWSQELRLVSTGGPQADWQWVTGLFYSQQKINDLLEIIAGNSAIPTATVLSILDGILPQLGGSLTASDGEIELVRTHPVVAIKEEALFGDVTRRFWHSLELTLGGRLYRTDSNGTNTYGGAIITAVHLAPSSIDQADVRQPGFNPHASLLWHVTPDILGYVATAKGFRAGGVQAGVALLPTEHVPSQFNSDSIWNYEGGIRTQWFDRTVHFDVTGFYERWKDPQYDQPDSTGLITFLDNVGGVKSLGGTAALQWALPIKGLLLNASGGYADTVTTEPYTGTNGKLVPTGARWPFSSRWQTATTLDYTMDLGELTLNAGVTHTFLGKAVNDLTEQFPIFGYQQWDGNISIGDSRLSWLPQLSLNVSNALDKRALYNAVFPTNSIQSYTDHYYIAPRAITLRLSGRF